MHPIAQDMNMTVPVSCLTCRERVARTRGVCPRCYTRHKLAVARGETTWAALEAAGLVLPAQPGRGWRDWNLGAK
jgi:hypothetical protein